MSDQPIKRRFPEDYAPVLYVPDMAEIWTLSVKRAYALAAEGAFDFARLRPSVARYSYSRDRVKAYLDGNTEALRLVRKKAS